VRLSVHMRSESVPSEILNSDSVTSPAHNTQYKGPSKRNP
jgi:hypothetical protein